MKETVNTVLPLQGRAFFMDFINWISLLEYPGQNHFYSKDTLTGRGLFDIMTSFTNTKQKVYYSGPKALLWRQGREAKAAPSSRQDEYRTEAEGFEEETGPYSGRTGRPVGT